MNLLHSITLRVTTSVLGFMLAVSMAGSANAESSVMSARDLAATLSARQDGTSYVRLRLDVKQRRRPPISFTKCFGPKSAREKPSSCTKQMVTPRPVRFSFHRTSYALWTLRK
jgi:hypothetical protein